MALNRHVILTLYDYKDSSPGCKGSMVCRSVDEKLPWWLEGVRERLNKMTPGQQWNVIMKEHKTVLEIKVVATNEEADNELQEFKNAKNLEKDVEYLQYVLSMSQKKLEKWKEDKSEPEGCTIM